MGQLESEILDLEMDLRTNNHEADDDTYLMIVDIANEAGELEAENVKLRELVRAMLHCANPYGDCDSCAINGAEMPTEHDDLENACYVLRERLRELGIGVEG